MTFPPQSVLGLCSKDRSQWLRLLLPRGSERAGSGPCWISVQYTFSDGLRRLRSKQAPTENSQGAGSLWLSPLGNLLGRRMLRHVATTVELDFGLWEGFGWNNLACRNSTGNLVAGDFGQWLPRWRPLPFGSPDGKILHRKFGLDGLRFIGTTVGATDPFGVRCIHRKIGWQCGSPCCSPRGCRRVFDLDGFTACRDLFRRASSEDWGHPLSCFALILGPSGSWGVDSHMMSPDSAACST